MGFEQKLAAQIKTAKISVTTESYFSEITGLKIYRFVDWGSRETRAMLGIRFTKSVDRPRWTIRDIYELAELIKFCKSRNETAVVFLTKAAKTENDFKILPAQLALHMGIDQITEKMKTRLEIHNDEEASSGFEQELKWWNAEAKNLRDTTK